MRNNGRFVAAEECIAMGCGDLFKLTDSVSRHRDIDFPGHRHASLYDVHLAEPAVKALLLNHGITLYMEKRITRAKHQGGRLIQVESDDGYVFRADAFVDATGSSGPQGMCQGSATVALLASALPVLRPQGEHGAAHGAARIHDIETPGHPRWSHVGFMQNIQGDFVAITQGKA